MFFRDSPALWRKGRAAPFKVLFFLQCGSLGGGYQVGFGANPNPYFADMGIGVEIRFGVGSVAGDAGINGAQVVQIDDLAFCNPPFRHLPQNFERQLHFTGVQGGVLRDFSNHLVFFPGGTE